MKVVVVKFKKGKRVIKSTAKNYLYICPFDKIDIGDFVVVDIQGSSSGVAVARIEAVEEISSTKDIFKYEPVPTKHVLFKVPSNDYEGAMKMIRAKEAIIKQKYEKIYSKKYIKPGFEKRKVEDILSDSIKKNED